MVTLLVPTPTLLELGLIERIDGFGFVTGAELVEL
jgi:hypothetical protein